MTASAIGLSHQARIEQLCRGRLDRYFREYAPLWSGQPRKHLPKIAGIVGCNLRSGRLHALTGLPQSISPNRSVLTQYVDRVIRCYDHTHILMEKLEADDPGAWRQTYKEVYAVAYRMLCGRGDTAAGPDAEELAQTVCETVYCKTFPYDVSFRAWAAKIAVRRVLQRGRSRDVLDSRQRCSLDRFTPAEDGAGPADGYTFYADESAGRVYERVEQHIDCLHAMDQMRSKLQRSVIEHIYLEGMDADEVARRLNVSLGAVHTLHHRGLRSLKRLLN